MSNMNKVFNLIENCQTVGVDKVSFKRCTLREALDYDEIQISVARQQVDVLKDGHIIDSIDIDGLIDLAAPKYANNEYEIDTATGNAVIKDDKGNEIDRIDIKVVAKEWLKESTNSAGANSKPLKETYSVVRKGTINAGEKEYAIEVELTIHSDPNYGADTDGNRGEPRTSVEDVRVISLTDSETGEEVSSQLNSMPEVGDAIDRWVENQDVRADETIHEAKFVVWDKKNQKLKTKTDGGVLEFDNQAAARKHVEDVLGEPNRYELLARTNTGVVRHEATVGAVEKIIKEDKDNRAKLDGVMRLYMDVDADEIRMETGFSINTVNEDKFMAEFEKLVEKYKYPETDPYTEDFRENKKQNGNGSLNEGIIKNATVPEVIRKLQQLDQIIAQETGVKLGKEPIRFYASNDEEGNAIHTDVMLDILQTGSGLGVCLYPVSGSEITERKKRAAIAEASNLDMYKKLLNIFGDFTDQHPGSGIGKIYRALLATGLKAIPKDKRAQAILNSFVDGLLISTTGSVHDMLNKNFTDLPLNIKPVYKDGNRRLVPFWCKGETLCSKVVDLFSLGEEPAGKWTDEQRAVIKLDDAHTTE